MMFGWAGDGRWWAEVVQRFEAEVHESFHSSGYEVQKHSVSPKEEKKEQSHDLIYEDQQTNCVGKKAYKALQTGIACLKIKKKSIRNFI